MPAMIRWPGLVKPNTEINGIFSAEDWVQTLIAAAGEPDIGAKLLRVRQLETRPSKYISMATINATCSLNGPDKRREFFYWTDDGDLAGLRYDQYKIVFMEQPRGLGGLDAAIGPVARTEAIQPAL